MENLEGLKKLLNYPQDVVILSHRNPDGDAVGSSLGLSLFLQKHGHNDGKTRLPVTLNVISRTG
jgi:phosphoesterase RecJ-like protein